MGDHELADPPTGKVDAKVWASSAAAAVLSGLVAVANAVQDTPGLLAPLPKAWQAAILLLVPLVSVFAAGYVKASNRI